jgi:hypothetical protein
VPQPTLPDPGDRADFDPLLMFTAEPDAPAPPPPAVEEPAETGAIVQAAASPGDPVTAAPPRDDLADRLGQVEQALDQSAREIASLKAELATLVAAVQDISSRLRRKAQAQAPVQARPARELPRRRFVGVAAAATVLIAILVTWPFLQANPVVVPPAGAALSQDEPAAEPVAAAAAVMIDASPIQTVAATMPIEQPPVEVEAESPAPRRRAGYVGTLAIDADPNGAVVLINRKIMGRTPLRLTELRAGSHLVWIEREGYRRWTGVVLVPANQVTRVNADLQPLAPRP